MIDVFCPSSIPLHRCLSTHLSLSPSLSVGMDNNRPPLLNPFWPPCISSPVLIIHRFTGSPVEKHLAAETGKPRQVRKRPTTPGRRQRNVNIVKFLRLREENEEESRQEREGEGEGIDGDAILLRFEHIRKKRDYLL